MMKRIIVTGATGIVGMALIEVCLQHGVEVYAVVRPDSPNNARLPKDVNIIECNLSQLKRINSDDFPPFDVFYHFGWTDTTKKARNNPLLQAENIEHSLEAVRLSRRLQCRKFVGSGSQAEYGIHKESKTGPMSITNPITAYGISKFAAGKLCRLEALNNNMDYAWVRIFSLYGEYAHDEDMIKTLILKLRRNEFCPLTKGSQNWDYLYSEDAGLAFYKIGETESPRDTVYCLGSGQARSIRSYVEDIKELLGSKSELGFGEIPYDNGVPPSMCANIESLTRDTGFTPKIKFEEGIRKMISFMN